MLAAAKNIPIPFQIRKAAEWLLMQDGVIAYPTEAVYGLGCLPDSDSAIARILHIKDRDWRKGVILVASEVEQVIPYISDQGLELLDFLEAPQEHPVTWLMPVNDWVSPLLRGTHSKIAIRLSQHPTVRALCDATDSAIVSTSANRAGQAAFTKAHQVRNHFMDEIDQTVSGNVGDFNKPSAIIDAQTQTVIRAY